MTASSSRPKTINTFEAVLAFIEAPMNIDLTTKNKLKNVRKILIISFILFKF